MPALATRVAVTVGLILSTPPSNIKFFELIVLTPYTYIFELFWYKTALSWHGRIDHVIANAGVGERGNWFDPALTVESVEEV